MASTTNTHCAGCGEDTLNDERPVMRVRKGKWDRTPAGNPTWKGNGDIWGIIHESCFLMAIGDPAGVELMTQPASS